ncbi:MAG: hypothetical protein KatS3mg015_0282 [Fimbriimonadales bacterium]|nr:MAG: hypothetical protein KatS3mg015_0282 [Fimbriimonadales bacterium]
MKTKLFAIAILAGAVSAANAAVLWDNNLTPNGFNGRAISPPAFPNIRVVDDIVVGGPGWIIDRFNMNIIDDSTFQAGNDMDVYIYNDNSGTPGSLHSYNAGLSFTRTATGLTYFGRADYNYSIDMGGLNLGPGTYWIGARNANASGSGTNYWMTSDGGPDGAGTSTGYFSLDGGNTFSAEGAGWHHAFTIEGNPVPEPATMLAIGAGLAALAARRRRK